MTRAWTVVAVVAVQVLCTIVFLVEILWTMFGLPPIRWQIYEIIEIGAGLGLLLGIVSGLLLLRRTLRRNDTVEGQLRRASAAFLDVLEERFRDWGLTPAERDVALFAVKGMSTQEIASLRGVSEGTIKAQTNAIYRKAGVSGRPQLLSLFIDDMLAAVPDPK